MSGHRQSETNRDAASSNHCSRVTPVLRVEWMALAPSGEWQRETHDFSADEQERARDVFESVSRSAGVNVRRDARMTTIDGKVRP